MGQSSLLGAERAAPAPKGHDTEALGPSDSSDSGSDMAGLADAAEIADPALPLDVALRDSSPHAGGEQDPPDDEDPDLAFIDGIQAQDLESADDTVEERREGEDDEGEHCAMRAGTLPVPPQPNPAPDEPEAPERPDQPADEPEPDARSVPALLRRPR